MRVICIDAKDGVQKVASMVLVEGDTYDVYQCPNFPNSYKVVGLLFNPRDGKGISYKKSRFIPLSTTDELETLLEETSFKSI